MDPQNLYVGFFQDLFQISDPMYDQKQITVPSLQVTDGFKNINQIHGVSKMHMIFTRYYQNCIQVIHPIHVQRLNHTKHISLCSAFLWYSRDPKHIIDPHDFIWKSLEDTICYILLVSKDYTINFHYMTLPYLHLRKTTNKMKTRSNILHKCTG